MFGRCDSTWDTTTLYCREATNGQQQKQTSERNQSLRCYLATSFFCFFGESGQFCTWSGIKSGGLHTLRHTSIKQRTTDMRNKPDTTRQKKQWIDELHSRSLLFWDSSLPWGSISYLPIWLFLKKKNVFSLRFLVPATTHYPRQRIHPWQHVRPAYQTRSIKNIPLLPTKNSTP